LERHPDSSPKSPGSAAADSFDASGEKLRQMLEEVRAGSRDALGQLLQACRGYLLSIANRELDPALGGKLGASDLVQETLLEAQHDIGQFRGASETDLLAWLRQILDHNLRDVRRRYLEADKRCVGREEPLADGSSEAAVLADSIDTPSVQVSNDEQVQRLCRAMRKLPQDYQRVIQMRNWELLSFAEIGSRLQRSEEAARKLWVRAIERLQHELGAADGQP
jgi:RNA polymerase sigma-70 factor (ECF subfamily)